MAVVPGKHLYEDESMSFAVRFSLGFALASGVALSALNAQENLHSEHAASGDSRASSEAHGEVSTALALVASIEEDEADEKSGIYPVFSTLPDHSRHLTIMGSLDGLAAAGNRVCLSEPDAGSIDRMLIRRGHGEKTVDMIPAALLSMRGPCSEEPRRGYTAALFKGMRQGDLSSYSNSVGHAWAEAGRCDGNALENVARSAASMLISADDDASPVEVLQDALALSCVKDATRSS
jgi:hypothetical protein